MSDTIKEHISSDACGGQNSNNSLVRFLLALVSFGRFHKIHQYFLVCGRSFFQCGRDFDTAKLKIRKNDRIYTPEDYNETSMRAHLPGQKK